MKKTFIMVKVLTFTLAIGLVPFSLVNAQDQNKNRSEISVRDLPKISTTSPMGNFHANFSGQNVSANFLISHLGEWLGGDSSHTFGFVKSTTDELGIKHDVYQHFYKGVKVMDEIILLHEKEGKLVYVNGEISTNINTSIGNAISMNEAQNVASADMKAVGKSTFSDFEQVVVKVNKGRGVELYSASKVEAFSLKPLNAFTYYIDNSTKSIVKKVSKSYELDTPSNSLTYYKGTQPITVDSYNGSYRLKDNARNIHTLDATNLDGDYNPSTGELIGAVEYTNNVADFTSTATKPAIDVQWGMEVSHDYYVNRHNRNSYDGNGSLIRNYYNVDFSLLDANAPPGYGMNAAAIDQSGIVCMVYGNGDYPPYPSGFVGNPVVGIDVAGHEYSHLIIGRNGLGGLTYQGESGALNESIADMMGTAIEFYSGISPNWLMGEGILNPAVVPPGYFRSMSDPNSGPVAFGAQQPDTYQGTYWVDPTSAADQGGVHTNSGVGNYWFYLLSAGGSGTNDIGNTFNVTGITIQKAEKIIYRALMNYMTPNTTYLDAYNATRQAATDLYGASSNEQLQNNKAWYAVGIGNGLVLGTNEVSKMESQFNVYPNPVKNGAFSIENNQNEATFEMYDVSGKLVKQAQKLTKGTNKININGIQKGVYLVKINSNGASISKKIVVE